MLMQVLTKLWHLFCIISLICYLIFVDVVWFFPLITRFTEVPWPLNGHFPQESVGIDYAVSV